MKKSLFAFFCSPSFLSPAHPPSHRLGRRGVSALLVPIFFLPLLAGVPHNAFAVTSPVGATPGSFAVNQNGGASYTIPLTVPPGTAGMEPKVALSYDKQIQSDLLGVGWSVSGLSLIQRCGRTIALDLMKGGVNYDANDRFCLDGQRLIAMNGEYHPTRIDYTGNANVVPVLSTYSSVQFVYGTRTDTILRYEGGSIIKTTYRLTNVKTCTGATSTQLCADPGVSLVRDYQLAYDNNGAVGASRLLSVTECGSDGVCLPGTILELRYVS